MEKCQHYDIKTLSDNATKAICDWEADNCIIDFSYKKNWWKIVQIIFVKITVEIKLKAISSMQNHQSSQSNYLE